MRLNYVIAALIILAVGVSSFSYLASAEGFSIFGTANLQGTVCVNAGTTTPGRTVYQLNEYAKNSLNLFKTATHSYVYSQPMTDVCDGDSLKMYFCIPTGTDSNRQDSISSKMYKCQYGCSNGVCNQKPSTQPPTQPPATPDEKICVNAGTTTPGRTINQLNEFVKNSLNILNKKTNSYIYSSPKTDFCSGDSLNMYYCIQNTTQGVRQDSISSKLFKCQYGCNDGVCNQKPNASQPPTQPPATPQETICVNAGTKTPGRTINQLNEFAANSLNLLNTVTGSYLYSSPKTDFCSGDSLNMYYCVQNTTQNVKQDSISLKLFQCQYGCSNGICKSQPDSTNPPTQPPTQPPASNLIKGNGVITNIWSSNFDVWKQHKIKYVYVDVGDVNHDTGMISTPWDQIQSFLDREKTWEKNNNYDLILLPWNAVLANDGYNFASATFRQNWENEYLKLVNMGYDGVLMDAEAIPQNSLRTDYLNMLKDMKSKMPSGKLLTVYAGDIDDNTQNSVWTWTNDYFRQVCNVVDMISTQGYDIGYSDQQSYTNYLANQMKILGSNTWGCSFMWSVPTHKSYPETLDIAMQLYKNEVVKYPNIQLNGLVIFADWTTDSSEWQTWDRYMN